MMQLEGDENGHMSIKAQRVYVYGIIRLEEGGDGSSLPPISGLAGDPIRTVASNGLAAIVSVLATPATGLRFEEELKIPERARSLILDHHHVLRRTIDDRTVLPVRFGVLFPDDMSVAGALGEHHRDLVEALERVDGAREWGVKIFCDRSVLSRHLSEESPAICAIRGELSAATDGRAFFLRRQISRLGEEEAQHVIEQHVDAVKHSLCAASRGESAMKLQPTAVHGRADEMVWNGAFLVDRQAERHFLTLVDDLLEVHAPRGFDYEITGPWPPFSFADCRLGGRENGCSNGT